MALKYKVGDRVLIKSLDWYNANKSKSHGTVACGGKYFDYDMREWCGKIMTILTAYQTCYIMQEAGAKDLWTDEMIEGLAEEENQKSELVPYYEEGTNKILYYKNKNTLECYFPMRTPEYICPEGYQFVDENGNVVNAQKIVLEKKKKEYPKTYTECCTVLHFHYDHYLTYDDENDINPTKEEEEFIDIMDAFSRLIVCRNAYWKIYGEEMGLGKPWEPDYNEESYEQGSPIKYVIYYTGTHIAKERKCTPCYILSFPTAEMRDEFYENFKKEIEICKELL